MNDTLRELLSSFTFIVPLMRVKKTIKPERSDWGGKNQYFLFYPSPSPKSHTLVVYFNGGGWTQGAPADFHYLGQHIALNGFDCALMGYRKAPKYHFDDIVYDVFNGWLRLKSFIEQNGRSYGRVIIMGSSAGAHLSSLLCYDRKLQKEFGVSPEDFTDYIGLAAPLCFEYEQTFILNSGLKKLFNSKDRNVWKEGEPIRKLEKGQKIRALIVQSRHDGAVGFRQAEKFCKKAKELGIPVKLFEVKDKPNTHSAYSAGIFLDEFTDCSTYRRVMGFISGEKIK